jgi:hypothetical protein
MSSRQLLRLAGVLVAVLLLWGVAAVASKRSGRIPDKGGLLPKVDTASLDTIALTTRTDTAILSRSRGAGWQVNGHPADPEPVKQLLKGLADTAQPPEVIAESPASHARLRVTDDSGRRVRLISHGRLVADLIAGKHSVETSGIYLRRNGKPEVYLLRSPLADALDRSSDEWRNHTLAEIPPDSVSAVEIKRGPKSYILKRSGTKWTLGSGRTADSARVAELLSAYHALKAAGFAHKAQEDSIRSAKPRRSARLLDKRGAPLLSMTFDSAAGGFWVRVTPAPAGSGSGEVYRMESWTADQLTPADSTFRKH